MNKRLFKIKIKSPFAFAALLLIAMPVYVQAQDAIGRVIEATGLITATDAAGDERRLARGSEIFTSEVINTGPRGNTKLRLTDGAVLTLDADSVFTVNEYEFDGAGGAADSVIMTMARGTMRTLTGVIGDDPADTYEMNTPFASIGVRGTEYAIVVEASGRVRVFVFDGSIAVSTPTGGGVPTVVGIEGDADSVEVDETQAVVELSPEDIPPAIQEVIDTLDTTPVAESEVAALPSADIAVEVQTNTEQRQQEQQQQESSDENVGEQAAGVNVDPSTGTALVATTETEIIQARTVVVVSVEETNPGSFSQETVISASPN